MHALSFAVSALAAASYASAAQYVITVGGNTSTNASLVFDPQEVHAQIGDFVVFNFTEGNHTAIQSTFAEPCIPASEVNSSINGFDTGFRDAGNGTAITIYNYTVASNDSIWFFDWNTCAEGGVGVINANDSSTETLAGFERNAERLNGTATASSSIASATSTGSSSSGSGSSTTSASGSSTTSTSGAGRNVVVGGLSILPLLIAAVCL